MPAMRENLGLFLHKRAQLGPKREALIELERGRRFTYAELDERASRCANALLQLGVKRGDRVAVLMMNGVEYIESYFALARIGAVMVPLNWRLTPKELEFILGDAGAVALLFDSEFDAAAKALHECKTPLREWLRVGSPADENAPAFAQNYEALCEAAPADFPHNESGGDDNLFIMYTSGTTGLPKGVVHSHATMIAGSFTILMTADIRPDDTYLQMLPLFHVGALSPLTSSVHRGARALIMRQFDPARVFPAIKEWRADCGLAVPAMLNFMLQAAGEKTARESGESLRWLLSGAAPVPVPLIKRYAELGIEIHQVYGLTESAGPACLISGEEALRRAGSTGPAFFHTDVRVVGADGRDCAPGEIGEVLVRGRHLMKEYWNRPDATAETLRDGWLHSGDMAHKDADGFLYIRDRKKDMIISGGENVYPAEIENVLMGHPEIADAAVIGQPSERWGESAAAVIVRAKESALTADAVREYVQDKLARFKQPRAVEFADEIPRNPTGKILKRILRERYPGPAPE